ncbi:hypothetical protein V2G26_001388 [Clonostachys chloroleuca]
MAPKARDNAYVEKRKEGPYLQKILKQEDEKTKFLKDLVKRVDEAEVEAARLKLDLNEQRNLRIRYQKDVEALSKQISEYQEGVRNNSYVAVLIDGDGAIFHEAFLETPAQGAPEACRRLNENIKDHLKSTGGREDLPVLARVYADLDNLANAIHQSGIVDNKEKVSKFFEHFTNSRAEFEFINVGFGKENADCKMKKMLDHYYTDPRCERIYFVGCHDGGYSHVLKEHLNNRDQPKMRIFLVETTPAPYLFKWLDFEKLSFGDVFRKEPLPSRDSPFFHIAASRIDAAVPVPVKKMLPIRLPPSHASSASNDGFPPAIRQPAKSAKYIYFNKNGARVDPEMDELSQQAKDSYMEKYNALKSADTKQKVFCNSWYLNGQCRWAEDCEKVHDVELTEELLVHGEKVRSSFCYNGVKCEDFDCMLSHHCPEGQNCRRKYKCKFITKKDGNLHYDDASMKIVFCLRERTSGRPIKLKLDS